MSIIGIDNGTTGTIGFICGTSYEFLKTPTVKALDYTTSKKQEITRLNTIEFINLLARFKGEAEKNKEPLIVYMERPLINPLLFKSSITAVRCFEAELVAIESLELSYLVIDSKAWQKTLLPPMPAEKDRKKKRLMLKSASMQVAIKLFPREAENIKKHKDGDGLLIARYGKLKEGEK
jgi:hypothetical protein